VSQGALQLQTISPLTGANEVAQTNTALAALASMSSGTVAPTLGPGISGALVEGQIWLNTSVTPHRVFEYNGTAWVPWFAHVDLFLHANCGGL
jgi:hypothetical protein